MKRSMVRAAEKSDRPKFPSGRVRLMIAVRPVTAARRAPPHLARILPRCRLSPPSDRRSRYSSGGPDSNLLADSTLRTPAPLLDDRWPMRCSGNPVEIPCLLRALTLGTGTAVLQNIRRGSTSGSACSNEQSTVRKRNTRDDAYWRYYRRHGPDPAGETCRTAEAGNSDEASRATKAGDRTGRRSGPQSSCWQGQGDRGGNGHAVGHCKHR